MSNKLKMGMKIVRKWRESLKREPGLSPAVRAERIAAELNLDPVSVTKYIG